MNKAIILGRLGQDPELKELEFGSVCTVSVATTERWKKDGEQKEDTQWHRVEFWNKQAEIASQYLKKGSKVLVEGKIKTDQYEKDGETRYVTKIRATNLTFVDSKAEAQADQPDTTGPAATAPPTFDKNDNFADSEMGF